MAIPFMITYCTWFKLKSSVSTRFTQIKYTIIEILNLNLFIHLNNNLEKYDFYYLRHRFNLFKGGWLFGSIIFFFRWCKPEIRFVGHRAELHIIICHTAYSREENNTTPSTADFVFYFQVVFTFLDYYHHRTIFLSTSIDTKNF